MCVYTYTQLDAHILTHKHMQVQKYTYIHMCRYTCTHTSIYTYACMHTHIYNSYTQTCIHTQSISCPFCKPSFCSILLQPTESAQPQIIGQKTIVGGSKDVTSLLWIQTAWPQEITPHHGYWKKKCWRLLTEAEDRLGTEEEQDRAIGTQEEESLSWEQGLDQQEGHAGWSRTPWATEGASVGDSGGDNTDERWPWRHRLDTYCSLSVYWLHLWVTHARACCTVPLHCGD